MSVLRLYLRSALAALPLLAPVASLACRSRAALQLENPALRHQLGVLRRSVKRPKLTAPDRLLWAVAVCGLEELAVRTHHRQTRNRRCITASPLGAQAFPKTFAN